ncbi:anti-sigma F factor [Clostridia bacterium]|nr:anti-sigma F factor [Clostridia bacterium]GHV13547.1 anti-sigma F factor [Clostridia bacterium]
MKQTSNSLSATHTKETKSVVNYIKVRFPAKSVNESLARMVAASLVCQIDPTIDELADIKTAVSEAVTNCIVHAYSNSGGVIDLTAQLFSDRTLRIVVRDKGIGISDIEKAKEPLFTTDHSGERSGMGFSIMESFCDKMRVTSHAGKGTVVTLEKKISTGTSGSISARDIR